MIGVDILQESRRGKTPLELPFVKVALVVIHSPVAPHLIGLIGSLNGP